MAWRQNRPGLLQTREGGEGEKEILTLDLNTMEYREKQKARFASIEAGKAVEDTRERLRALLTPLFEDQKTDKAQQFIWGGLSEMCLYAGRRMREIADNIVDVDRAMRWGFAWELGPFEMVDAIGLAAFAAQIKKEDRTLPAVLKRRWPVAAPAFTNPARAKPRSSTSPPAKPKRPRNPQASSSSKRSKVRAVKSNATPAPASLISATAWSAANSIPR